MKITECLKCNNQYDKTGNNQKYCKECGIILRKEWARKADKKWLREHKEQRKKIRREQYLKNSWYHLTDDEKQAELKRKRDIYWKNPELSREKERAKYKKWVSTEKGRFLHNCKNYRRRARMRLITQRFTTEQWLAKLHATNGICPMCKRNVGTENMELDHIIPISKCKNGFIYTIDDVQPLCTGCNRRKKDN